MDLGGDAQAQPVEAEPNIFSLDWILDSFRSPKDRKSNKKKENEGEMQTISRPGGDPETMKFRENIAAYK